MAIEVGTAYVSILPETSKIAPGITGALDKAQKQAGGQGEGSGKSFASGFNGVLGKALKVGAIGGAAVAAGAGLLAKQVIDRFGELQQNLGGSEAVFGRFADTIKTKGADAYKALGVSQSDYLSTANKMGSLFQGSGLDQQKSLDLTSKGMQRAADVASVMGIDTATAMESITGAAKGNFTMMDNLGVAMNAASIEAYALEKGLNFKWTTATQAEKTEVAMEMFFDKTSQYAGNFEREATQTLSGSLGLFSAAKDSLIAGLGDANADVGKLATNLIDALGAVIENVAPVLGNVTSALPALGTALVEGIATLAPSLLTAASELVQGLVTAIVAAAPGLVEAAIPVVLSLTSGLLGQLPAIVDAALKIVIALANGISAALPTLIPQIVDVVLRIVDVLIDNADALLDAALALIMGLADGIIAALPQLVAKLPTLIDKIVDFLVRAVPQLIDAGLQLLDGIIQALPLILPALVDATIVLIEALVDAIPAMIPMLVDAAVGLFTALVEAIPIILPPLIAAVVRLIPVVIKALAAYYPRLLAAGAQAAWKIITGLVGALAGLAGAVLAPLGRAFDAITRAAKAFVDFFTITVWGGIKWAVDKIVGFFRRVGQGYKNIWNKQIKPALKAFRDFFVDILWGGIKWAVGKIVEFFRRLGRGYKNIWETKIKPVLKAFKDFVVITLWGGIKNGIDKIKGLWTGLKTTISNVWNRGIKPIFAAIKKYVWDNLVAAFRNGIDSIGRVWDKLKGMAGKPVNFLIGTVYNSGIRKMMNLIPGVNLSEASTVSWATGGVLPGYTPGRDVHTFYSPSGGILRLSGGEGIMRPEFVRAVGGAAGIARLNKAAQSFARGGVVMPLAGARKGTYPGHDGVDLNVGSGWDDYGLPIRAFRAGAISYVGTGAGYGLAVFQTGPWGTVVYGHMSRTATRAGAQVGAGQVIGYVGNTGNSSAPHLHFGIPGSTYGAALALLGGATNVFGGMRAGFNNNLATSAAQVAGERKDTDEKSSWLDAIRSLPGKARSLWESITGLGARFGEWGEVMGQGARGFLDKAVTWVDDFIPNKIELKWLPDVPLPDKPVRSALDALGVFDSGGILDPGALAINASNRPEAVFNARQFRSVLEGAVAAGGTSGAMDLSGELTIANWDEGIAYFEGIADERVEAAGDLAGMSRRAGG